MSDQDVLADAARFRWLLDGNGYFLEEHGLCGGPTDQEGQDEARWEIDEAMGDQLIRGKPGATLSEATLEEIFQRATRQYRRRAK